MRQGEAVTVRAAYAHCRGIARREAKNFYWAFRVLPQHKSDAMCAVYAFMRKADDLADDESLRMEDRRTAMREWTEAWRASRQQASADPVFVALNDAQKRFQIPDTLLEQLVAGTTMDLQPKPEGVVLIREADLSGSRQQEYQVYENFVALYRYCYLVASVVGLVCIRIFGYTDKQAEVLAEHTGVAFQLTNILRDVREDAERGRIYLPLRDMTELGVQPKMLLGALQGKGRPAPLRALLQKEIDRARDLYQAADELIPLLDADARPAMEVLVTIYRRLLDRVARDPEAVLNERISVHLSEKLGILGRGLIASGMTRLGA